MSALDRVAERPGGIVGEARWPMASVVLAAMALTYLLPVDLRLAPRWVLPLIEGLLLVAVVVGDPGQITRRSALLRGLSMPLVPWAKTAMAVQSMISLAILGLVVARAVNVFT